MRHAIAIVVTVCTLILSSRADAQVISFNEIVPQANRILGTIDCGTTTGFHFSSDHFHVIGTQSFFSGFSSNGTTHIGYESRRGFPVRMDRVGGGTFSLLSFDADEFYIDAYPPGPDAHTVEVTGIRQDGSTVSHTVTLDGLYHQPYQHFVLPSSFVNLTAVVFAGHDVNNLDGGISLDNIAYQVAVPETLPACVVTPLPSDVPTVTLTSPVTDIVAGTVTVAATASDNVGVVGVQFKLDGVNLGAEVLAPPYQVTWDTTTATDTSHLLSAEARDAANNVGVASVAVEVFNTAIGPTTPHYVSLDGVDDYLSVADASDLSFVNAGSDAPLTLELWLQPGSLVGPRVLVSKGNDAGQEYQWFMAAGYFGLRLWDQSTGGTVAAFTQIPAAVASGWHHVAVTYDGYGGPTAAAGITFYVDGTALPHAFSDLVGTYVAMENTAAPLVIGHESDGWRQYVGGLDELRMWAAARTLSEIQATMSVELTGTESGLVAYWRFNEGTGPGAVDATGHAHTATLRQGVTWLPGGLVPDVTAPTITNIATPSVTSSTVTVTFTTSEVATGWVSYTANATCPCTDVFSPTVGTLHTVTLAGLTPNTLYRFQAKARDVAGNTQVAPEATVQTLVFVVDNQAPTVTLTSPAAGPVAGTVTVAAIASDTVGVVGVQFKLDGVNLGAEILTPPYQRTWDTTTVIDGPHTLSAEARDAANNVGVASVAVSVANTVSTGPHYVSLDGVDDYLSVADANDLSFVNAGNDTPLTLELRLQPGSLAGPRVLVSKGDDASQEYQWFMAAGYFGMRLRDQSTAGAVTAYAQIPAAVASGWHHVAVTYDGRGGATAAAGITFYVDGAVLPASSEVIGTYVAMENTATPLVIGHESDGWRQYLGGLDELRVWAVARTLSALQATMNLELAGTESGLVAYWRFNEGAGLGAVDATGHAHTATLRQGVTWLPGGLVP